MLNVFLNEPNVFSSSDTGRLGFLLTVTYRMGWHFQLFGKIFFCNNLRLLGTSAKFFIIGESECDEKFLTLPSFCWSFYRRYSSAKELNLFDYKLTLIYCEFQSCWVNALEDCPNVPSQFRSNVGCNPFIVLALSTLVIFDNCVQVLAIET